jgi:tetratricopeptide (TPR) repeat protein
MGARAWMIPGLIGGAALAASALAQIPDPRAPVTTDARIQLFESWVAADPSTGNKNLLAAAYLQKTRETNDFAYLERASRIVSGILAADGDYESRRLRIRIELIYHRFRQAAAHARELLADAPADAQVWGLLGDALLEMGDVEGAREAFQRILALRADFSSYNRAAYLRFITGDLAGAIELMRKAVDAGAAVPENQAWCAVELGHLYFKAGRLEEAESAYKEALKAFPAAHAAHAGLGSVEAARGNPAAAVKHYQRAQTISPMVQYAGALYDLYAALGNTAEARKQAARVDLAAALDQASGEAANRTVALIFANQDRNLEQALAIARADFAIRQGVYTEDALAWALYKNGLYAEARAAAQHVAAVGTPDPLFYYHAGMIALAAGERGEARENLRRALELNPGFDIAQAAVARRTLAQLER